MALLQTGRNEQMNELAQNQEQPLLTGRRRRPWGNGPIIQMQDASKSFGKDKVIVHDLNFEVQPGQIFCLLGPSGSGKSTTMRMLTGLYRPTEGIVRVFGQEPSRFKKEWRERMGYMPQQFVLFPELSTQGNINFVASVYGMSWFNRSKKIQQALEFVDLWESRNKLASQLSGGMQRRLELAATLINNPDLIFVDEPTAGIDPILRAKFWEHFRQLSSQGRTLFVTTQYVTEADYCDVVAILNRGRVLALGAPEDIRRAAFGGDIVNVTLEAITTQALETIRRVPGVLHVQFLNNKELKLTVSDAEVVLPLTMSALQDADITLQSIEQSRPNFEEVFVQLMEQDEPEEGEEEKLDRVNRYNPSVVANRPGFATTHQPAPGPPVLNQPQRAVPSMQTEQPRPPQPIPAPPVPSPDPTMPEPPPGTPPETVPMPPGAPGPTDPDSRMQPQYYAYPAQEVPPTLNELAEQPNGPLPVPTTNIRYVPGQNPADNRKGQG